MGRPAPLPAAKALDPGTALERKPLAMRRRLQRNPAGIPLDWRTAQQRGPESGQIPRTNAVQHNLAYPADRAIAIIAHQSSP
jgi:hypothetical protein